MKSFRFLVLLVLLLPRNNFAHRHFRSERFSFEEEGGDTALNEAMEPIDRNLQDGGSLRAIAVLLVYLATMFCSIPPFSFFCDECNPNSCANGGTCTDLLFGSFTCDCPAPFSGPTCLLRGCDPNPCLNGGTCTDVANGGFTCACTPGFEGDTCETNPDDCVGNPCGEEKGKCFDASPPERPRYTCICNDGYELNSDKSTCVDVNECDDPSKNNCDAAREVCENLEVKEDKKMFRCNTCTNNGNAACDCPPGQERDTSGLCVDIDECANGLGNCVAPAVCQDKDPGFECKCPDGQDLMLAEDQRSCIRINDCLTTDPCRNGGTCVDAGPTQNPDDPLVTCVCPEGFNGKFCDDLDECLRTPFPCGFGKCENTLGGFQCDCGGTGYTGDDCTMDIDECSTTKPCQNGATCTNKPGFYTCECTDGWQGTNCDVDKNECDLGTDTCVPTKNEVCFNIDGSFRCDCKENYEKDSGGNCVDIDECDPSRPDPCPGDNDTCSNKDGGFDCVCKTFYAKNAAGACVDIDECIEGTDNCEAPLVCENREGGFNCFLVCSAGFERIGDMCEDINECERGLDNCDEPFFQTCRNVPGTFSCDNNF